MIKDTGAKVAVNIFQKIKPGLLALVFSFTLNAGDIIPPPVVHWIGPEANCDYPTIQTALDDVFDCGIFACPPGVNELRLSANYNHQGLVVVNETFNIRGGYNICEGSFNGIKKLISPVIPNSHLFVITPPENTVITNEFSHLSMVGATNGTSKGGVILMGVGETTLRLKDSNVISGTAEQGGGIAMLGGGNVLEIIDSIIAFNQAVPGAIAEGDGGGIYCENGGTINFISGDIHDNEAARRGGGMVLDNCQLIGNSDNKHRFIQNNTVVRSTGDNADGFGGGIFAKGDATHIELGALLSRTFIANNEIRFSESFYVGLGGGIHLQSDTEAELTNVQFIANKARAGGAISLDSNSALNMDRSTGPCDPSQQQQCSAFIDNEAIDDRPFAGRGSAVFTPFDSNGASINIKRTVFRGNDAYGGGGGFGSMININDGVTLLEGNLMFLNSIEDDLSFDYYGQYLYFFKGSATLIQNTIAFNENSGAVLQVEGALVNTVGNLIFDPAQEYGIMDNDRSDQTIYSACNITSDELIDTVVNGGENDVVSDPGFIDSMGANFRLLGSSPAVNRCDDELAMGLISLQYDIDGRSRITNGPAAGFGPHDAGAFEFHFNLGQEVDLETHLELVNNTGPIGAVFEVQLRNIGMNPALPNNTFISFEKPDVIYTTAGNWSCNEVDVNAITMVECKYQSTIAVLGLSTKLTVDVAPNDQNDCHLQVIAESRGGTTTDTDLTNNSADAGTLTCGLQDLIFANGFE